MNELYSRSVLNFYKPFQRGFKSTKLAKRISMILAKYIWLNYSKSANGLIMEKSDIALENQKIKIKMLMSGSAIYWFNPNQLKGRYTLAQGT